MKVTITVAAGPQKGRSVTVSEGGIAVVGTAPRTDLRLEGDPAVAERHCSVSCGRGGAQVLDLESRTGTLLNGQRVSSAPLAIGDRIQVGDTMFVVGGEGLPESAAADDAEPIEEAPPAEIALDASSSIPGIWEVEHDPGIAVRLLPSEDPVRGPLLTVIVKMTFTVQREEAHMADVPLPVLSADVPYDDTDVVRLESDIVPFKRTTDVVLVGNAYAPGGVPVTELPVGVRVGKVDRGIMVVGDRRWEHHRVGPPTMSIAKPFKTMPLTYDRAFGGIDEHAGVYCAENPTGCGIIGKNGRESVDGKALPNLEHPGSRIQSWSDRPPPVGFGFYGRAWQPRLAHASARPAASPGEAAGPDDRFWNAAHPDLQAKSYLRGNETVELVNVHRRDPRLTFRLPGLRPSITVTRWKVSPDAWLAEHVGDDGRLDAAPPVFAEAVKANLDTVVFLPDEDCFYEVFRGVCGIASLETLEVARVTVRVAGGTP